MFFRTGSDEIQGPEEFARSNEIKRECPEEPEQPVSPPYQEASDADDEHADAEVLGGDHWALVATDHVEEGRAEGPARRRLGRHEESREGAAKAR